MVIGPQAAGSHHQPGHPERPERVAAVVAGIDDLHLGDALLWIEPRLATRAELLRVHTPGHLGHLERLGARARARARARDGERAGDEGHRVSLDADTYLAGDSYDLATRAAGAGLQAIAEAQRRRVPAMVAVRPPGHHATAGQAMGFCLLNNVAVAAASLVASGQRVAIIDWDVHHGNGTEAIFWDNPDVLYVSTHQWPCYPGTGQAGDVGGTGHEAAKGGVVNVPLPPGTTGDLMVRAFAEIVTPVVDAFSPDWVLVSAGFDAHRADPLADLALSAGDYGVLATLVAGYAPHPGRLVVFLEGGYDLSALRMSTATTLAALVGADLLPVEAPTTGGDGTEVLARVAMARRRSLGD